MERIIVMITSGTTIMITPSSTSNVLILTLVLNCLAPSQAVSFRHLRSHSSRGTHGQNKESAMKHNGETLRIKTFRELFGMMRSVNNYMTAIRSRHNRRLRKLSRTSLRNLLAASLNPSLSSLNPAVELQYPPQVHSSNPAGFAHNAAVSSQDPGSYSRKQTRVTSKNPVSDSKNPDTVSQNSTISSHRSAKGYSSLIQTHDIAKAIQSISSTKRYRIRHFKIRYGNNRPFDSLASGLIG